MDIEGTEEADYLTGTADADVIRTLAGGDTVILTAGRDTIDLGSCYDTITYSFYDLAGTMPTRTAVTITDTLVRESAGLFNSTLTSAELFYLDLPTMQSFTFDGRGFSGTSYIDYEGGAHQIVTGTGDDLFAAYTLGGGSFDGGAGFDIYSADVTAAVPIVVTNTAIVAGTQRETIANVEFVSLDDEEHGGARYSLDASAFSGGVGLFLTKGGATVIGGHDSDAIDFEDGLGGNVIDGRDGIDAVSHAVTLAAGGRIVLTEDGNVVTVGGTGFAQDRLTSIEIVGVSVSSQNGGTVEVDASDLTARVSAHLSAESQATLTGGAGDDMLYGSFAADRLVGGAGDDYLFGADGRDNLIGGTGADTLYGGEGADTLSGGAGVDSYMAYGTGQLAGDLYADISAGERIVVQGYDESRGALTLTQNGKVVTLNDGTRFSLGANTDVHFNVLRLSETYEPGECGGEATVAVWYELVARAGETSRSGTAHDVDGDGRSDIVWRNDNGALTNWFARGDGFDASSGFSYQVATQWKVAADGDFNGDGRADVLWRHDDGRVTSWNASGNGYDGATGVILDPGVAWKIAGVGDFSGDGRDDILWRNDNGLLTDWLGNGASFDGAGRAAYGVGADWQVAGLGDFNADGRDDILWRNTNGTVTTWTASSAGFVASSAVFGVGADWDVAGVADFNGDGRDDILWRNAGGTLTTWNGDSGGFTPTSFSLGVATSWEVAATGDYNGDGRADILWRGADGQVAQWLSDGTGFTPNNAAGAVVPNDWDIVL